MKQYKVEYYSALARKVLITIISAKNTDHVVEVMKATRTVQDQDIVSIKAVIE